MDLTNLNQTVLSAASSDTSGVNQNPTTSGNPDNQDTKQVASSGQAYDYAKMIGDGGALADSWRDGLPEDIRNEKCLDSIKTIGTLAKSYVNGQRAIGAGKVVVPTDKSTPDEWAAFYKAGGRPDSADGYTVDSIKSSVPEGIIIDDDELKSFREFAFENGLSQKAFENAVAFDIERVKRQQEAAASSSSKEYQDTMSRLRSDYGDGLAGVIQQCNKALQTFGLTKVFADNGLLNNYDAIKALASVGSRISESRLVDSDMQPPRVDPSSRLNEIMGNPDDPYYNREHPAHRQRIEEVKALLRARQNSENSR